MADELIKRIEKIEQNLKAIENRHELMLSAVMEHLTNQSNILKQYTGPRVTTSIPVIDKPHDGILISEEYRDILYKEHINKWGIAASQQIDSIQEFLSRNEIQDFIDYGCGSGSRLKTLLPDQLFEIQQYDPGVPSFNIKPDPSNGVICVDVLEHVEPKYLDNVLSDLQRLLKKAGYFSIGTSRASRILSDGRNAHLTIESADWWCWKLSKYFNITSRVDTAYNLVVEVTPLG